MIGRLGAFLSEIAAPSREGVFNVRRLEDGSAFYAGRDSRGHAAVLIATSDAGRTVPLRLAGIEATFATPYQIVEPGTAPTIQTLTAVVCTNTDENVVAYFASVMESLLPLFGDRPSAERVAKAVRQIVDLFQRLRRPARRSVVGLVGELSVIDAASDVSTAVRSWRTDPDDRFDFGIGKVRLDVKASSHRHRMHDISFEQANPPEGSMGLVASIWIEAMAGGTALAELVRAIETKLAGRGEEIIKLRTLIAETLGDTLPQAMTWCFDEQLATDSLRYFYTSEIPAIRPPLPDGVSSARFTSDLSRCTPLELALLAQNLNGTERGLLPRS